jgi:hypothetical protein
METAQRFSMRSAPATEQAQLDEAGFVCAEHRHDDGSQMATLRSWAPGARRVVLWLCVSQVSAIALCSQI